MKTESKKGVWLLIVVSCISLFSGFMIQTYIGKYAVAASSPPRYKVVDCSRDARELEKMLNDYAKEGWHFRAIDAGPILILGRE